MGFFDTLRLASSLDASTPETPTMLIAADTNYQPSLNTIWWTTATETVGRNEAMTVPAVARARNIICGTVGSLPLERYNQITEACLPSQPLQTQPDPASPRSVTYAWLADSILFYGIGYMQVLAAYPDGRPMQWRWIDPNRVQPAYNDNQTMAVGYNLDGVLMPESGPGALIAFPGADEGLLRRAGRTIKTAIELEAAAYRSAQEPTPQTVLKNTGVELPNAKITELLTNWKAARQAKATAYLGYGIDMQAVGFDPKSQQLVEARQFHASEIARAAGIPAWYLNAESSSMTYSNTEQERRTLIDFSLKPILDAIAGRMSMLDITPRGIEIEWDIDDFLRGSTLERVNIAVALTTAGLASVDEARKFLDIKLEGNVSEVDL